MSAIEQEALLAGEMDYCWQAANLLRVKPGAGVDGVIKAVRRGFTYGVVESFMTKFRVDAGYIEQAVGISRSTMSRRKQSGRFTRVESDRLLRIVGLYAMAEDVIGDRDMAIDWMGTPNRALGGETPGGYAGTEAGAREVEKLLGRLAHGVVN
ncbi:MAG: DUF2384 domain-containing protein [Salinisphaeraceae bacterium]